MIGHELAIEQLKSAKPHPRHQPGQRHFGGIGRAAEHALAKKGAAHGKAIKPADQLPALPALHAMRHAALVQNGKGMFDIGVDPCLMPVSSHLGTFVDHLRKGPVGGDLKPILPYRLGQRS
jgi:hypothetical protein